MSSYLTPFQIGQQDGLDRDYHNPYPADSGDRYDYDAGFESGENMSDDDWYDDPDDDWDDYDEPDDDGVIEYPVETL